MRNFIFKINLVLVFYIFISVTSGCSFFQGRQKTLNSKEVSIVIGSNWKLSDLAQNLVDKKLIESKEVFLEVAKSNSLNDNKLAPGKYRIKPETKLKDLVFGFIKNENGEGNAEVKVKVTIYNFRDIYQMASIVEDCLELDSSKLVNYLQSSETINTLGLRKKEELGALFVPKTYEMYFDTNEKEFIQSIKSDFDKFWNKDRLAKIQKINLKTPVDAVILASIVYAEQSKNKEEWPIISALYLNRLKKDMKLQSDPTFKYCWGDALNGTQRLLEKHRNIDCEYNTYKINGLPPGPICFTPLEIIDAVLEPAKVDYIFMCATPDYTGKHNFAVSDEDHIKNAKVYQAWIAEQEKTKK